MKQLRFLLALIALGFGTIALAQGRDWTTVVGKSANGSFVVGNPKAKVKLVEYVSYTCPHCAHFIAESAQGLRGQMVRSGSTSVELRNAVRDKLDLTAALLARCTGPQRFFATTDAMFAAQEDWFTRGSRFEATNAARLATLAAAGAASGACRRIGAERHRPSPRHDRRDDRDLPCQ